MSYVNKLKPTVKRIALDLGVYRKARYLSDWLTNRAAIGRLKDDADFYRNILPPGSLCFDVGANIGEKSEAMLMGGMRVIAFEPQPICVEELKERCGRSGDRLTICEQAVGSQPGEANLHLSTYHATASLKDQWDNRIEDSITVELTTLTEAFRQHGHPYYVKIDVEGWEYEVFKGMDQPVPMLSFEFHLSEGEIEKTLKCLDHISNLYDHKVVFNVTPAEKIRLEYPSWVNLDELLKRFPSDFMGRSEFWYGDIWVRSEAERSY